MHNILVRLYTAVALLLCLFTCIYAPVWLVTLIIVSILLLIMTTEWPRLAHGWLWLLTPVYPILPFVLAIALNEQPEYRHLLLVLIATVAMHDTGAYCAGKLFGKHKLWPSISPGKTWQGFAGGLLAVIALLGSIAWYQASDIPSTTLLVIATFISVVATAGDLFESWLKRRAGMKDSGSLLPGHGGLLDRFDGMMSCIYLLYPLKEMLLRWF